jgi:hypothetical protein
MTEEEAKTKWCPFARLTFSTEGFAAGNRFDDCAWAEKRALCIGSACMAWRVDGEYAGAWLRGQQDLLNAGKPASDKPFVPQGFCGLAGTP